MTSIPASQLVNVIPGVLGAGGSPLSLNAVFLTNDPAVPIGTVKSFATLADVQAFFGPSSVEAAMAAIYFNGFTNATALPGLLYFAQFNVAAVGAYLRGGSMAGVTLAQLQAFSGTIILTVNGVSSTSLAINLAAASSFSNAAALIQTAIQGGTPSSTATCTYDAQRQAFRIASSTTGAASTIGFATGTIAASLKLQVAQGAVNSQGAAIAVPASFIPALVALTQNWAALTTTWEPLVADKVLFAQAIDAQGQRYMYVGWDTNVTPTQGADPTCFAVLTAALNGRVAVFGAAGNDGALAKAAFICGTTAAINFSQTNGRITYAYKSLSGLVPDVTDATVANNLIANGYNFYGSYATANDAFQFLQNGNISASWKWIDAYVNQIKLNSDFQLALVTLLQQVKSLPYVTRGFDQIRAALLGPINSHLNFGSIVAGVNLSPSQRTQVNVAAGGLNIADTLQSRGWFLLIQDPGAVVRGNRGTPVCTFWYTDGGSIQKITLSSIDVQ